MIFELCFFSHKKVPYPQDPKVTPWNSFDFGRDFTRYLRKSFYFPGLGTRKIWKWSLFDPMFLSKILYKPMVVLTTQGRIFLWNHVFMLYRHFKKSPFWVQNYFLGVDTRKVTTFRVSTLGKKLLSMNRYAASNYFPRTYPQKVITFQGYLHGK